MNIRKTLYLGSVKKLHQRLADIHAWVEVGDDGELSISGVIGARPDGNSTGSCGQIQRGIRPYLDDERIAFAPDWDHDKVVKFLQVWERWHLNHLRPGSPNQMNWLRANPIPAQEYAYPKDHYTVAKAKLKAAGLEPDRICDRNGNPVDTLMPNATRNMHVHHVSGLKTGRVFALGHDPELLGEFGSSPYNTPGYALVAWAGEPGSHWVSISDLRLGGEGTGYSYGSKWLKEDLPQEVCGYLAGLPEATTPCPWYAPWEMRG